MNRQIVLYFVLIALIGASVGAQTSLTEAEIDGLLLMREEEKLARDVYLTLGETWNLRIFHNISRSEQTHMDRMATLLKTYGIQDPIIDEKSIGRFENPVLSELYDELIERGKKSRFEALLVGREIEELDINDLKNLMAGTDEEEILVVYENLLRGSENHLAAFNRQLSRYK